ncbi:hypothetical protein ACH5RR_040770 [Cinchona calisaya]|uniref:Uncharacterized protein n=1 Tax=Cinchona calisaya TaxID=153742 RepID=A0ABD2XTB3_9GENT
MSCPCDDRNSSAIGSISFGLVQTVYVMGDNATTKICTTTATACVLDVNSSSFAELPNQQIALAKGDDASPLLIRSSNPELLTSSMKKFIPSVTGSVDTNAEVLHVQEESYVTATS